MSQVVVSKYRSRRKPVTHPVRSLTALQKNKFFHRDPLLLPILT